MTTDKGPVAGTFKGQTNVFLGIPYAAPPVGALRWKPPVPAAAWSAPLDATAYGPACLQSSEAGKLAPGTSEDCLTLNVWAPANPASEKAPVLFWIHGGAFAAGSGRDFDGQALSEATGAVVITINYRLGPLGFLALPDLSAEDASHPSSGMYGIEDQHAALVWAKANVQAFGGDPDNVTIFGQSAGGISTCLHLLSPQSKGLFQRAILESGTCTTAAITKQQAEATGAGFTDALGCSNAVDRLSCLRGKTSEEVLFAVAAGWFPFADGFNIPESPQKMLADGNFTKVPTLLGTNKNEGGGGLPIPDDATYAATLESFFPGKSAEIMAMYPSASYGSPGAAFAEVFGDVTMVCPTRMTAQALSKAGVVTYLYRFVHEPLGAALGTPHSAELPFIFGGWENVGNIGFGDESLTFTPEQKQLSSVMQSYWFNMAKSGDPNSAGAAAWPQYDAVSDQNIVLDLTPSTQAGLKKDHCNFWDQLMP
ncbi:carboxylesterase/lipase family protein [Polyangium sp. 15x6]|uniref:carboxylesterase/lipase family protein n=1 Tax=Polyangium sp. 15x6 TaxID=3042687 RepID=UPI00249B1CA5|nr:carboxylesterase/lipase family protein [Polyangium sp. 15x6]MDI3290476.1 carboxylesterase/lipase family protein [Polyangium sp. 15x6]